MNEDPDIGAIVLTGAGRAFSSGADVSRFEANLQEGDTGKTPELPRTQVLL